MPISTISFVCGNISRTCSSVPCCAGNSAITPMRHCLFGSRLVGLMEEGLIMNAWTEAFALPVVVGCLVLSWAGLEKLRDRAPLVAVVAEMGVPRRFALVTTVSLLVAELGTVSAVLAGLPSYLPGALFSV